MKEIKSSVMEGLPPPEGMRRELPGGKGGEAKLDLKEMAPREKAAFLAEQDFDKTINILKGWAAEEKN